MDAVTKQVQELYSQATEEGRRQLLNELRELQQSFDSDWDMLARLGSGFLQGALVKTGVDAKLFEILSASNDPISLSGLAQETGGSPKMMGHILRALAAFGFIQETVRNEYTANRMTRVLAKEDVAGAMEHFFAIHSPVAMALPSYLQEKKYQDITSNMDLPFHRALNTDLEPFEWMKRHPEQMKALGHGMKLQRPTHWTDSYPIVEEVGSFAPDPESALLVDVGGGFGQQSAIFKNKYSSLPGRVVVQDLPQTLNIAPSIEGIEFQAHDFFTPQPLQKAKFYYLRHICHDWPDAECVKILQAILPAMGPESKLVIDEVVVPDEKVPWQVAYMDITMMAALGGVERTKTEWENLLDLAGFKIVHINKYDEKMQSALVSVPK
ncbi:S-adenosyl-L-methionine-dependent methyltransferase [Corynespora cassiicola Philippines]|uniref:S-adenosyl-L-methionine-dependent methyltransferase n=1 Tax=Corynespora cassiicola Philippines TaxID=1448308 RepID=A0A2T2NP74_CORCC|nr:S-adenosyl-L-methionine-dependent methyltransferase [Corynespora cassiicola Philippines]